MAGYAFCNTKTKCPGFTARPGPEKSAWTGALWAAPAVLIPLKPGHKPPTRPRRPQSVASPALFGLSPSPGPAPHQRSSPRRPSWAAGLQTWPFRGTPWNIRGRALRPFRSSCSANLLDTRWKFGICPCSMSELPSPTLQRVRALQAQGHSLRKIAVFLQAEGVPPPPLRTPRPSRPRWSRPSIPSLPPCWPRQTSRRRGCCRRPRRWAGPASSGARGSWAGCSALMRCSALCCWPCGGHGSGPRRP